LRVDVFFTLLFVRSLSQSLQPRPLTRSFRLGSVDQFTDPRLFFVGFTAVCARKKRKRARSLRRRCDIPVVGVRVRPSVRPFARPRVAQCRSLNFSTKKNQTFGRHTPEDDDDDDDDDEIGVERRRGTRRDIRDAAFARGVRAAMRVAVVDARFFAWEPKRRDW